MRCQTRPLFDFSILVLLLLKIINAMSSSESIRREGSTSSATPEVTLAPTQSLLFPTQPQHCLCHLKLPRAPASPSPWWEAEPCPSSSTISQCRHKTTTRNNHRKRQERPHTTNSSVQWPEQPQALQTGRDRAQARPPRPMCCPCLIPHRGTAAHRGPSKMWKCCPVLGLLIAKLFGRKRRV